MDLDNISVEVKDNQAGAPTFTLRFDPGAKLTSDDEANVGWLLKVKIVGWGTGSNGYPRIKEINEMVGPSQTPASLKLGDKWEPTYEHTFQRNEIAVKKRDVYAVKAQLVPKFTIWPTEKKTFVGSGPNWDL